MCSVGYNRSVMVIKVERMPRPVAWDTAPAIGAVGRLSSAALMASGLAGLVMPNRVAAALELPAVTRRGIAETRAGLGGTYAALGGWALLSRDPTAQAAVGVVWLGAAGARIGSLLVDQPETDGTFWAYLAVEIGLGAAALVGARRMRRAKRGSHQSGAR
jgi:hypothetical protein